jgi:hypothetical protein
VDKLSPTSTISRRRKIGTEQSRPVYERMDAVSDSHRLCGANEFGAPVQDLTSSDFAEGGPFFHMGREPVAVDMLTEIPGVDFDVAWERRVEDMINTVSGVKANFISRADLMTAKLVAGRPQDLADVDALRRAEEAQRPQSLKKRPT